MPSVQYLREFINERLTAAAEQIFLEFEKTIVQYEEEIDRQRRLLDITWKPQIKLHRTDVPQQQVCEEEEEVLPEQQLWNQERSSSVDQEEPEPPQIKEEQEELCSSQEGEQLGLKEETEVHNDPVQYEEEMERQRRLLDITWKPQIKLHRTDIPQQDICEEEEVLPEQQLWNQERSSSVDQEEPEPPQIKEEQEELCSSQEGEQLGLKEETDTFMVTTAEEGEHSEPGGDGQQLLSDDSPQSEITDEESSKCEESGSSETVTSVPKKRQKRDRSHDDVESWTVSESPCNAATGRESDVCQKSVKNQAQRKKPHTDVKPYRCDTCGKSFSDRSTWKRHLRTHTEVLLNHLSAWFGNMTLKNKNRLGLLVKPCSKLSGRWQDGLLTIYNKHVLRKPHSIVNCLNHPLHSEFDLLPSGRRFRVPVRKTKRLQVSFIPTATRLLNGK
ncbi:zinc finger protein 853 isoform X4 [Oreochromis niloticus]|uniref:zinc finger protein 853 isoform X4 n=1 Tax=Oreochromis niloticus TaxID=8128 RepID=UPI0009045E63|nr:zinc finger protein 853 isoform X4 [Oreochromis niloticus]